MIFNIIPGSVTVMDFLFLLIATLLLFIGIPMIAMAAISILILLSSGIKRTLLTYVGFTIFTIYFVAYITFVSVGAWFMFSNTSGTDIGFFGDWMSHGV